jgi:hypothetical protein
MMNKFIQDMLTEDDNNTYCIARFAVLLGVITFCVIGVFHVYRGLALDFSQFGVGFGSLLGGGGVLIGGKAVTQKES